MENEVVGGVHWSFWVIGALTLIWNVMGVINFFVQLDPEAVAAYRESERVIIDGRPVWATGGFAIAVFGGALGSFFLLLRRSVAHYLFILSIVGVFITVAHTFGLRVDLNFAEILGTILMPLLVAAFLIGYSHKVKRKGWLL